MVETEPVPPFKLKDVSCPRCGRATDTFACMPVILYCDYCGKQWINLENLDEDP